MGAMRSTRGHSVRRTRWPGALRVTIMTVAVMLAWTAWVLDRVQLPADGTPSRSLHVLEPRSRDCPNEDADGDEYVFHNPFVG